MADSGWTQAYSIENKWFEEVEASGEMCAGERKAQDLCVVMMASKDVRMLRESSSGGCWS